MNINGIIREKNLVIPLLGAPGITLSKTTLRENLTNSEVQYKTLSMLIDKFSPDGIFPMMDLTVEIEALGSETNFPENANPSVAKPLIKNREDLKILKGNWQGISGRMKVFIEVMEKIAKKYSIIKGGYVIGPFTMAGELMGANDIAMQAMLNPELVAELVNFSLEVISEYANALFNAGADAIAVLEPLAVILSSKKYKEFSLYPFKKLVSNLNNKPLILHICGNTNHLIKSMLDSGAVGLSLDSVINFEELKKIIPPEITLMGNLNPVKIFLQSTPDQVAEATKSLKESMKDTKNFILSSGCDIPLDTPLKNIEAFMKAARGKIN
jgi:uroporphyrinogen decarboxylase